MVPDGWMIKSLAEVCSKQISYGIVQTGEHQPNGIPCLRVVDLTKVQMQPEEMIRTSTEIHQAYQKTILEKDEIVMALRGEVGLVRRIDKTLIGANITRGLARISADKKLVAPEFLLWELRSPKFRADLMRRVGGSALQEISLTELRKVQTLVPPLPEQKKIAQILSTWDRAITTTEQLLANSQQQKKALMQQLLTGKRRLLDDNGVRFSGEWKSTMISKMGKILSGGTPDTNTNEFWGGGINWLTPTDVTSLKSRFVDSTKRTISEAGVRNSSATLLPAGSLMVCTRATIGALAISTSNICTNQGFKNIVPFKDFDVDFIYYMLSYRANELLRKASGSTFLELSKKDFEKIEFPCPLFEEQQKIAAVLSVTDQEIALLQQKLDSLKQEKKALMQQLLTGKCRVQIN